MLKQRKEIIITETNRTKRHSDNFGERKNTETVLFVTGHECTDVLLLWVRVFLDTRHMIRRRTFCTFDPFIIINVWCKHHAKQGIGLQDVKGILQEHCK